MAPVDWPWCLHWQEYPPWHVPWPRRLGQLAPRPCLTLHACMHSRLDPAFPSLHALIALQGLSTLRLFGPDLCCGFDYFNEFLQALTPGVLDAATVHRSGRHQSLTVSSLQSPSRQAEGEGAWIGAGLLGAQLRVPTLSSYMCYSPWGS